MASAKSAKLFGCFDIAPRPPGDILLLIERKLTANSRGRSEHKRARRNLHAASEKRVCSNDGTRADSKSSTFAPIHKLTSYVEMRVA
jgi:hypothetical protein